MSGAQEAAKSTSDPGSAVDPVVLGLVKFYAAVGVARAYDEIEQEAQGFLGDHLKKKAAFEEICAKYPNATDETMQQLRSAFFANDPVQTENVADANEVKEGGEDSSSSSSAPAAAPVLPDPVPAPTPHDVVVGVDVGAKNTTSAISTSDVAADVRSLRNANLSVAMPSCISLPGAPGGFRKYGDEAECDHGNGANTFTHLLYLPHDASSHDDICSSVLSTSALHVAEDLGVGNSGVNFQLQDTNPDGDGSSEALAERLPCVTVSGEQALSMFLRKIFLRAGQVFAEENPEDTSHHSFICSLTAPSCLSEGHRARICTAAEGAGFDRARVTTNVECLAAAYLTRHVTPVADSLEFPFLVGFVDYGHAQFSVGLAVFYRNDSSDEGVPGSATYAVLSERSVLGAAGQSLDLAMAQHFAQQFATRKGTTPVSLKGRKGKRLVRACSGAKHALSLNPQARFMVDAMGQDGDDARFEVSRDEFVKFCSPQFDALRTAICEAMVSVLPSAEEATAGGTKSLNVPGCSLPLEVTRSMLGKVELVGGGSRSPVVQSIVAEAMGLKESQLSYTLDIAMSLSQGAAVATNRANEPQPAGDGVGNAGSDSSSSSSSDHVANLRKQEVAWATLDDRMREIHSQCNQLEAFISSMRTAIAESSGAPDGERMDSDVVGPILDQAEELTWAPWAPDIGARCEAKRKEIDDKIRELCSGYFAKKAADRAKYEAELARLAAEAKAEQEASGPSEEDHDRRKLKASKRLRNANVQKKEGNELFAGKNYDHAAIRYRKALLELGTDKFAGELTEEEEAERTALLVSCQLNAAACWLKLGKPIKAEANCSQVLHLEEKNVKALFRRATARFELKEFSKANEDVKAALDIDPESKAAKKLQTKIQKVLDKRLAAKKKMAGKMFGGAKKTKQKQSS